MSIHDSTNFQAKSKAIDEMSRHVFTAYDAVAATTGIAGLSELEVKALKARYFCVSVQNNGFTLHATTQGVGALDGDADVDPEIYAMQLDMEVGARLFDQSLFQRLTFERDNRGKA